jgi:hypothetical protein
VCEVRLDLVGKTSDATRVEILDEKQHGFTAKKKPLCVNSTRDIGAPSRWGPSWYQDPNP